MDHAETTSVERPFYTPYSIHLRDAGALSDNELLHRVDLSRYRRINRIPTTGRYAAIADAGPWKMLADDGFYTLWHMPTTRPAIAELARRYDVFACSVGDCDRSFDFVYYRDGRLVRKYVVESPHFSDRVVVADEGDPLAGEAETFRLADELAIVRRIAESLGIPWCDEEPGLRIYAPASAGGWSELFRRFRTALRRAVLRLHSIRNFLPHPF